MPDDSPDLRHLYLALLTAWNNKDAAAMAACFAPDGGVVGFDGSQVDGRENIEAHLGPIFADHPTAAFVALVRWVRFPAPGIAILRGVAGMVPRGLKEVSPAVNAVQTLVAMSQNGLWLVALFQNTPATFHGRPELLKSLTAELQAVADSGDVLR
jgi:uncharacterized protein (TIGR02246 family)